MHPPHVDAEYYLSGTTLPRETRINVEDEPVTLTADACDPANGISHLPVTIDDNTSAPPTLAQLHRPGGLIFR